MASLIERLEEIVPAAWAPYFDVFAAIPLLLLDVAFENTVEQVFQARIPTCPVDDLGNMREDSLTLHGRDRRIYRGPLEPGIDYARRLVDWLNTWRTAGSVLTLLRQIEPLGSPSPSTVRLVTDSGVWYTLEADTGDFVMNTPDGTGFRLTPTGALTAEPGEGHPWDWDSESYDRLVFADDDEYEANHWGRYWIIVYLPTAVTTDDDGTFGDGLSVFGESVHGDPLTIGTNTVRSTVELYRTVVADFGPAGITCEFIITAFDPDSFDPLATFPDPGMPDGTWGAYGKTIDDAGTLRRVRARLDTARYWRGPR